MIRADFQQGMESVSLVLDELAETTGLIKTTDANEPVVTY